MSYYENPVKKSDKKNSAGKYYTLSFKYNFEFPDDEVYFSYSLPYTYQELISYLDDIKINYSDIVRVDELCLSLAGNVCPMITITEDIESYISFTEESYSWNISDATRRMMKRRQSKSEKTQTSNLKNVHKHKKGIIITSRVHSGETVSSYMMKGLIDFLTGSSREANILRSHYVFKIVPMLNPDGVRYGRTRCSLLGIDLNRR